MFCWDLMRQSEAISDNRWQNLVTINHTIKTSVVSLMRVIIFRVEVDNYFLRKVHLICANLILLTFLTTHNIVENLFVLKIGISTMHTRYLLNNSVIISDMFHLIIWRRGESAVICRKLWILVQALHTMAFFEKWDWEA